MNKTCEKSFLINNLGCANCAAKMEQAISKDKRIISASINFMTTTLFLTYDPTAFSSDDELYTAINSYITKYEHDAYLTEHTATSKTLPTKQAACSTQHSHCHDDSCGCSDHAAHDHSHDDGCNCSDHAAHHHCDDDHCGCSDHAEDHAATHIDHHHSHGTALHSKTGILPTILPWIVGSILGFSGILFLENETAKLLVVLVSYLLIGYKVLRSSLHNVIRGSLFDENFLMIIATIGALYVKEYPEALLVLLLFQIGEYLQDLAVDRSKKHLADAMNLKPQFATIETASGLQQVAPEEVNIGDILVIKPMEKVALDGVVIEGTSFLDTSSLTGEAVPRKATVGDTILSGCINGEQTIRVRVTTCYQDSTIAKVLDLVQNASNRKSITENFITKFARIYTPVVVILALLIAILPPILLKSHDFSAWIYTACGFLVVSCPCALVISVPLGFFGGIGNASKNGIIVKGSNYLEALSHLTTVVFDKTGTLTKGTFEVEELHPIDEEITEENLLYLAALLESFSTHPIATSIVTSYHARETAPLNTNLVEDYREISGHGVEATIEGVRYYLGNSRYMNSLGISNAPSMIETIGTIAYLAKDTTCLGYLIVSDEIKSDAKETIETLRRAGIRTVLLTGDTDTVAKKVAHSLGVSSYYADLLPTDKVAKLEELMKHKTREESIAFVGDGINDAPVIARADIGFAMGGVGSDAAIEAADIVLMTDEPSKITKAFSIAKFTRKIVITNIVFSLGIKLLVLGVLAFGYGSMWLAIFADVGVSLLAILNSIRVLKR